MKTAVRLQPQGTFSQQMAQLHREVFAANHTAIARHLTTQSRLLTRYQQTYLRATAKMLRPAMWAELLEACEAAEVIYVGDYHTLSSCRQGLVRLLTAMPPSSCETVALEFFNQRDQAALDAFIAGRFDEARLRHLTGHTGPPGVGSACWSSFRPLLALAQKRGIRLLALDSPATGATSLAKRDRLAAHALAATLRRGLHGRVWVLAGQMHLAPSHLPRALALALGRSPHSPLNARSSIIIYQNCESLYLQLLAQGIDHRHAVIKLRHRTFALMHTPPTVCQASFLATLDDASVDTQDTLPGPGLALRRAMAQITSFFALKPPAMDELEVVAVNMDSLASSRRGHSLKSLAHLPQDAIAELIGCLASGRGAWLPQQNLAAVGAWPASEALAQLAQLCGPILRHRSDSFADVDRQRAGVAQIWETVLDEAAGSLALHIIYPSWRCSLHELFLAHKRPISVTFAQGLGHRLAQGLKAGLLEGRLGRTALGSLFCPTPKGSSSEAHCRKWLRIAGIPKNNSMRYIGRLAPAKA